MLQNLSSNFVLCFVACAEFKLLFDREDVRLEPLDELRINHCRSCSVILGAIDVPQQHRGQYTSAPAVEKRRGGEESEGEKQGCSEYTQSAWRKEEMVGKEVEKEEEDEEEEQEVEREDERSQQRMVESHDPEKRRRRDETGEEDEAESAENAGNGEEEEERGICHLFEPGAWYPPSRARQTNHRWSPSLAVEPHPTARFSRQAMQQAAAAGQRRQIVDVQMPEHLQDQRMG
ncbi:unnamed protein product [Closterium sp. Naga37s-1]|nr:unnamed protein product [Closterium sp. Naga37s-1]